MARRDVSVYHVTSIHSSFALCARVGKMKIAASFILLVVSVLQVVPSSVVCDYPWPDNVTQHKGYIQVRYPCK